MTEPTAVAAISTRIIEPPRIRGWVVFLAVVLLADLGIFVTAFDGQIPFNYTYDITPQQRKTLDDIMVRVQQAWPDQRVVFDAAIRIQEDIGQQAIPSLIEYARHEDSDLRCFSVQMLGAFEDDIATDAVIAALHDEEPLVAFYATMALGTIGDPIGLDPLAAALDHPDYRVRAGAALNLSIVGMHNRHVEAMIAHLGDPSPRVNESIQESLTVGLGLSDMLLGREPEVWARWWEETGRAQANLPD